MSLKLHFPDDGWEGVSKTWSAWWAGELKRALVVLECVEPQDKATPHYASTFLGNYGSKAPAGKLLELFIPRLEATHYLGDAFPRFWPNFGPGIVATCAGAHLRAVEDTTRFSTGFSGEITNLHANSQARDEWWLQVRAVTQMAVEGWGKRAMRSYLSRRNMGRASAAGVLAGHPARGTSCNQISPT
jgi:hypothetical protein